MSNLQITGTITKVSDVQEGTSKAGKSWKKLGFLVEAEGEYPKDVYFTVFGEEKVDNFLKYNKVGQTVDVSFNVESREYNERFYTDLQAWKVFTNTSSSASTEKVAATNTNEAPKGEFHKADDLPF
tara:strand:- start:866 stop:1243 length:378 start_codon:yes stop_codon:yes gene_type:complete